MNRSMLAAFAALCFLGLHATVPAQESAKAAELTVIDLRPSQEKEGTGLAELAGKCNKDVYRIADVASDPLKVDALEDALNPTLGPDGKTLTVLDWSIYYNRQVQKKGGGFLSGIGVQGYNLPTNGKEGGKQAGSKCSRKESAGGWYEASELTSNYFPLISEFEGTYGGKALKIRVVYSPPHKLEGKFEGGKDDAQAVLDTVQATAEALATAVASR